MKLSNTQIHIGVRPLVAAAFALITVWSLGALVHAQDAVVGNLRLASDASGTPMETVPAGPGEKVYALETGDEAVYMAFDFSGTTPMTAQLRLIGPAGLPVHLEDVELIQPGPYVVTYDPGDRPLAETEYVANIYIQAEGSYYLADSLQMTVGDAELSDAINELEGESVQQPADFAAPELAPEGNSIPTTESPAEVPGPSTMLLMLAGVGVLGLLAVVAWAGMSAIKSS